MLPDCLIRFVLKIDEKGVFAITWSLIAKESGIEARVREGGGGQPADTRPSLTLRGLLHTTNSVDGTVRPGDPMT
jgi:hypothetical protein